ncbi:nitrous oxide reductase accessory protein NosL [Flavobacterium sp.]|uniref:nitrous oxide reductase accessory protein NosL n=1 Tax=Flavobacterium sp. TaxID=239 RepID=UPI002B4AD660|nr:nitrous oxide reductase accessory protein NosL [Flavobacterium sp.]HLF52307.1 nitrous oxide reductase accessory protein NosL [Flavobacterium sp.]
MNNPKISTLSRGILLLVGVLLVSSIFVPMWRIELSAPQYPEGLVLQLHANKIGGDVDIINGLNHYIGMKTLHKEDFVEFTVLPYIFAGFALFALAVAIIAKKKGLYALFISLILFGILAAVDFYRWNYEYGHNLDPNAAIRVPGMSYQPPLIGYKQLLNFGAYSIPDIGGWMLIASGLLLFILVIKESNLLQKWRKPKTVTVLLFLLSLSFLSCAKTEAVPIKLNVDNCEFCKMSIADGKYGSEVITQKGRVYKFDDIMCMVNYGKENPDTKIKAYYVHNYTQDNILIPAEKAFFLTGVNIPSPMRGNIASFSSEKEAKELGLKLNATLISWEAVIGK